MEDETQPLGEIRKPSAQPDWMKGNTNTKKILVGQTQEDVREGVYMDDRKRLHYEYIELSTTESESSQHLDPDSSDDDGHKECGLGGYSTGIAQIIRRIARPHNTRWGISMKTTGIPPTEG